MLIINNHNSETTLCPSVKKTEHELGHVGLHLYNHFGAPYVNGQINNATTAAGGALLAGGAAPATAATPVAVAAAPFVLVVAAGAAVGAAIGALFD
jgi:hypothetical protein